MARQPKRPDYDPRIEVGIAYARDVVAGRTAAGKWVRLACQRFLNALKVAESGKGSWAFDERFAIRDRVRRSFWSDTMKHQANCSDIQQRF